MKITVTYTKPLVFTLALAPLGWLLYAAFFGGLGVNPIETVTRTLGDWALRFLMLTLAITPLRKLSGWRWPMRFRRMLGLYAFFYTFMHLASYIILDQFFYWQGIWEDIIKRPYITVGMISFLMLIPLAVTSTTGMMRRLGKNWQRLHRLIYPIAMGGVLHYYMLVKADTREPLLYAAILLLLLAARLPLLRKKLQHSRKQVHST